MTLLTAIVFGAGFFAGFLAAWHWQRKKYEKILKVLGNSIRATQSSQPS